MIAGAKYGHTNLIARDWKALSRFYQDLFGCVPVPPVRDFKGYDLERGTGVAGAELLFLNRRGDTWRDLGKMGSHLLALVADDHHEVLRRELLGRLHRVAQQTVATDLVQQLAGGGLHSRAAAGGQHNDGSDWRVQRYAVGLRRAHDSSTRDTTAHPCGSAEKS